MSRTNYGFRTSRFPLRPSGFPWLPLFLAIAAAFTWIWALGPRNKITLPTLTESITQSPAPVNEPSSSPEPQNTQILETQALCLYAVQLSSHTTQQEAQQAQKADEASGLTCVIYPQADSFKVLDSLYTDQEQADLRKEELIRGNRDAYVFSKDIPAIQVELTGTQEEINRWKTGLELLDQVLLSPEWAQETEAPYTACGLASALFEASADLMDLGDMEAVHLAQTLSECAAILEDTKRLPASAAECALTAAAYVSAVMNP